MKTDWLLYVIEHPLFFNIYVLWIHKLRWYLVMNLELALKCIKSQYVFNFWIEWCVGSQSGFYSCLSPFWGETLFVLLTSVDLFTRTESEGKSNKKFIKPFNADTCSGDNLSKRGFSSPKRNIFFLPVILLLQGWEENGNLSNGTQEKKTCRSLNYSLLYARYYMLDTH